MKINIINNFIKLNKNKKGFSSTGYYIAALMFSAVIVFGSIMVIQLANQYDQGSIIDEDFEEKYSRLTEYSSTINQSLQSVKEETGLVNVVQTIFQSSFAFIEFLLTSLGLIGEPVNNFTQDFDVPTQIAGVFSIVLIASLTIVIVARIVSALTQRKI